MIRQPLRQRPGKFEKKSPNTTHEEWLLCINHPTIIAGTKALNHADSACLSTWYSFCGF